MPYSRSGSAASNTGPLRGRPGEALKRALASSKPDCCHRLFDVSDGIEEIGERGAEQVDDGDVGRGLSVAARLRTEAHKFVVLPKRWVVERTFAWTTRYRRLARDFERYARTVEAFFRLAMIRLMPRRLTRPTACS